MKQPSDSKKRIAFPVQLFDEQGAGVAIPDEIHIVPTGKWDHPVYGEMEITSQDIAQFVQNFKDGVRLDLPITAGHDNGMSGGELPAIGWFKELYDRGVNGLWAYVEWTAEGKQLLADRAFKYFSPEFYEVYEDPESGEKRENVLVGGALTNSPYFKELTPVVAFSEPQIMQQFNTPTMELKDIVAKKPEELSDEEKGFLAEHKDELDADQKAAFASVIDASASGETEEEKAAREAQEAADKEAAEKAAAEQREAAEKNKGKVVTMSEAEVKILRQKADEGAKAFAEVEKMKLEKEVDKLVFSESNKDGRILPKQKDAVVKLMFSFNETQRDQFRNVINNMPKPALSFGELGDGGKTEPATVFAEVETKVKEALKANDKLSYSEALRKVFAEDAELAKRYNEADQDDAE